MITAKTVPKLRFKEFTDEWQVKKLGDISTKVGSGSTPRGGSEVYRKSGTPFIRSQNITNGRLELDNIVYIDKKIHDTMSNSKIKPNDVLLNITGASLGRTCVVPANFTEGNLNQHVCIIRLMKSTNPYLVHTLLSQPKGLHDLLKTQTGGGKEGLNFQAVRAFKVALPSDTDEQQKIAEFLGGVDDKLTSLKSGVTAMNKYKQGVMQALFSGKLRFKDENGNNYPEWQNISFGEIFERITKKNRENNQNVLTISAQQGLVNQKAFFNKSVAANNLTGYFLLHKGDFAYNKSYSKGYPMGAIKKLNIYEKGVVSTLYICFRVKKNNSENFFEQYFNLGLQNRDIEKIAQEGARNHGLLNISVTDFFNNVILKVPSHKEQQKIADFLTSLDDKIKIEEEKLTQAKNFKKSLLQRMFV